MSCCWFRPWRQGTRCWLLLPLFLALSAGCGGGNASPTVAPTPTPPPREVILAFPFDDFPSGAWAAIPVYVPKAGRVDVTVDWTSSDTWMYVYFGDQLCTYQQLVRDTCPFIVESEAFSPKPRVLVTGPLSAGNYYVLLYNVPRNNQLGIGSDNTEALSIQVGLTP